MLKLVFLGHQDVFLEGTRLELTGKPLAILAYLAVEQREAARDDLARRLWSRMTHESDEEYRERAFSQLRGAGGLSRLRSLGITGRYIIEEKRLLWFRRDEPEQHPFDMDFADYLAPAWETPESREAAFARYEGDFLSGLRFHKDDLMTTLYSGWLNQKRDDLRAQYIRLLEELITNDISQQRLERSLERVNRCLRLMPAGNSIRLETQRFRVQRYQIALAALTGDTAQAQTLTEDVLREARHARNADAIDLFTALKGQLQDGSPNHAALMRLLPGGDARKTIELPPVAPFQALRRPDVFVMREELHQAYALLTGRETRSAAGGCPIVAVTGMGGVGKSTLSAYLAYLLKEQAAFPDGILWGDFASHDLHSILKDCIKVLHPTAQLQGDLAAHFRYLTASRRCLLVLEDIGEQFEEPKPPEERKIVRDSLIRQIRQILPNNPACAVLITTRDRELAYGLNAHLIELKEFDPDNALRLLAKIAGDEAVYAEADSARAICERLEYLPLALELAGQTIKTRRMKLADYEQRLHARPMGSRVQHSFEISWQMLGDEDAIRALFAQLAVFESRDFDLAAVQAVTGLDTDPMQEMFYELTALSLVRQHQPGRYRLHRLLAAFAQEKLSSNFAALETETRRRCIDYYLAYAEQHRDSFDLLQKEFAHLQVNLQHSVSVDPAVTMQYVRALEKFWLRRGYFYEARQGYETAVNTAPTPADRAYFLTGLGYMETEQADYAPAKIHLAEAEAYYRRQYEPAGLARTLEYTGRITFIEDDFERTETVLKEAGEIYEEIYDYEGTAAILVSRADIPYYTGDYETAKNLANLALEYIHRPGPRFVTVEQRPGIIQCYRLLLDAAVQQRDWETARRCCDICLQLCDENGDEGERALVWYMWASALKQMGEIAEALLAVQRGEHMLRQMGDLLNLARICRVRSMIYSEQEQLEAALRDNAESLALLERLGKMDEYFDMLVRRADLLRRSEQNDEACHHWSQAGQIMEAHGFKISARLKPMADALSALCPD